MMRTILGSALQFRFLVLAGAGLLIVLGIGQLRQMPVDILPEFAPPYVEVQTEALGLSADEVESLISVNLEELLNGTPWLKSIRSTSVPGLSSVVLTFEPGTDVFRARQLVAERLSLAYTLPNVSRPPVILQPLSATSRMMMIGLSSQTVAPIQMGVLARWNIRPALLAVPGVANVSVWGQRERQLQVQVDPDQLSAHNVTLDQIVEAAGDAVWVSPLTFLNASTPGSGGWIDTPQQRLEVRHDLPISKAADLAKVPVSGTRLVLGDVATVVEDHQPLIGDAVVGSGPGFLIVVEKFPGANTLEVTRGVESALDKLRPGLEGIDIETGIFRPASFIDRAVGNLTTLLIISALLAVLVLAVLAWDWRVAVLVAVVVSLSLIAAALVLYATGSTMNTMVLAGLGIALGLIVDDAIVDIDNIAKRARKRRGAGTDRSNSKMIIVALLEMRGSLTYASLVLVLAVSPIFFLQGVAGAFFAPLVLAYTAAVVASFAVALTVTPALGMVLLARAPARRREPPVLGWLGGAYNRGLARGIGLVRPMALIAIGLVLAVALLVPFTRQSLLPAFRESDVVVRWSTPPGTSHPEMYRLASQATGELQQIDGVATVGAEIGRAVLGDQVVGINSSQLWVNIDREADYDATRLSIERAIDGYPGTVADIDTYLSDRIQHVLTGSSDDLVVRIFGTEWGALRTKATEVQKALSEVTGVTSARLEQQEKEPFVQVEVDLARAERYGLKPGDVRRAASTYLAGIGVGTLFEEQKVFDVVVWSTPETRNSLTSVSELLIDTPNGGHVRLQDVADVRLSSSFTAIQRETVSRRIDVSLNTDGRDLGAVVGDVQARLAQIEFPLEYHAELLGEYAERQAAQSRLLGFAIAALIGILLLLQAAFGSWRLAGLLLVTLPMALVGGVLASLAGGGVLSIGSLVGFVTVLGIAARNGIMLINHYQHLEREEGEPFGPALVLRGARERLAPILMTSLLLAIVMLPIVVAGDLPGLEIIRPMAVVILGGLVTSTLATLFLLPALYLRVRPGAGAMTTNVLAGGS
ncbi:MAG: efflux RND transporter permease subunit [Chloroflexota bacterium]